MNEKLQKQRKGRKVQRRNAESRNQSKTNHEWHGFSRMERRTISRSVNVRRASSGMPESGNPYYLLFRVKSVDNAIRSVNYFPRNSIGEFRNKSAPLRETSEGKGCINQSITKPLSFWWVVE